MRRTKTKQTGNRGKERKGIVREPKKTRALQKKQSPCSVAGCLAERLHGPLTRRVHQTRSRGKRGIQSQATPPPRVAGSVELARGESRLLLRGLEAEESTGHTDVRCNVLLGGDVAEVVGLHQRLPPPSPRELTEKGSRSVVRDDIIGSKNCTGKNKSRSSV